MDNTERLISELPRYSPSAQFNARVLAAMGFAAAPVRAARWVGLAQVLLGALVVCWVVLLAILAAGAAVHHAKDIFFALLHPAMLLSQLKFTALKAAGAMLRVAGVLKLAAGVGLYLAGRSGLVWQLAAATLLAGVSVAAVSKKGYVGVK